MEHRCRNGCFDYHRLITIVWYVFQVIANWKIFNKYGEPGWKAIIPIYNTYIRYKATWNVKMFLVNIVLAVLAGLQTLGVDTAAAGHTVTVPSTIAGIASVGLVVLDIMGKNKLSKAFGHGNGFTVGLFFLDPIFKLILGFGSSKYLGNPTAKH